MEDGEPSPSFACLSSQGGDGSHAWEIEEYKEHKTEGCQRGEAGSSDVAAIEDRQCADDGLFGRQAGE